MAKEIKTNAMRILESNNIEYRELNLDLKEAVDGVTCANMLGLNLDSTFKTLVTVGKSKNYYVFVIPVAEHLDLKKAAKALKRIATKNTEDSVMTKEEFFVQIDKARKQIEEGHCKKMLKEENIDDFLTRNGYV